MLATVLKGNRWYRSNWPIPCRNHDQALPVTLVFGRHACLRCQPFPATSRRSRHARPGRLPRHHRPLLGGAVAALLAQPDGC